MNDESVEKRKQSAEALNARDARRMDRLTNATNERDEQAYSDASYDARMMTSPYADWYMAAMANGGVVPAAGMPLPVPVVVPVNLMPGVDHAAAYGGGMPIMMQPPPPPHYAAMGGYAAVPHHHHHHHHDHPSAMYAAPGGLPGYGPPNAGVGVGFGGRRGGGAMGGGPGFGGRPRGGFGGGGRDVGFSGRNRNGGFGGGARWQEKGSKYTVFVKDVPASVTERELAAVFSECGTILDCRLCGDMSSNKFSYAFVAFETANGMDRALRLDRTFLHGRNIIVRRSDTAVIPVNPLLLPQNEAEMESCARTIYVANVDKAVGKDELRELFETNAGVVSRLHVQEKANAAANVAFIEFEELTSAGVALHLTGKKLRNRTIRVSASKTPLRVHRRAASTSNTGNRSPHARAAREDGAASRDGVVESETPTASSSSSREPTSKVYVKNIPKTTSPGTLRSLFGDCGEIEQIELLNQPKSKYPYAFVKFRDVESAHRALDFNGKEVLDDAKLVVELTHNERTNPIREMDPVSREKAERTVYVTDIDPEIESTVVRSEIERECGAISLFWYKAFDKGEIRAIAYVEFEDISSVAKALAKCRTRFLSGDRLLKVRHSFLALKPREGSTDGLCHTPECDSPPSVSSEDEDENGDDKSKDAEEGDDDDVVVVRNLESPLNAESVERKMREALDIGGSDAAA